MSETRGQNWQNVQESALPILGKAARTNDEVIVSALDQGLDSPMRMFGAIVPDTKLYFSASRVKAGDGSMKVKPAIDDKMPDIVTSWISFSGGTTSGATFQKEASAFSVPAGTIGQFIRMIAALRSTGEINVKFSAQAASVGALTSPETLFSGLDGDPVGFIDLEYVTTANLKTAGSATTVIQAEVSGTSRIFNIAGGGGSGGGSDRTYKVTAMTATVGTIKGGYRGIDDKRVLSSGSGTTELTAGADVTMTMATILTQSSLSFVANKIYALVIDLTTLSAAIALDNLRQVITWTSTNLKLLDQADLTLIDPRRYVLIDQIFVPSGATDWSTAHLIQWTPQVHDSLAAYFPYVQRYSTQITSASSTNVLTHGLDAEPQVVNVFYYDGTNKNGKDLSSHLLNKNATQLNVSSLGLTFGGGQYLEVVALYVPTIPNIASASRTFTSPWYTSTATTTVAHGLSDMEDIRGLQVQEWDVTAGKRRVIDTSALIVNFDAVNVYLSWTGLVPSSTLQYRFFVGGSPIPWSIRDGGFDSVTNASGAGAPNFPNGATGISTGINGTPIAYRLTKQAIGAIGTSGHVNAGHLKLASSYPAAATPLHIYPLASNVNDSIGTKHLTNVNAVVFTGTDIKGTAAAAAVFAAASSQSLLYNTDNYFNAGDTSFTFDAWVASDDWTPATAKTVAGVSASSTDRGWFIFIESGVLYFYIPTSATGLVSISMPTTGLVDGSWHHVALSYDATTDTWNAYFDGALIGSVVQVNRTVTANNFRIGAVHATPADFFSGRITQVGYTKIAMADEEIRKLYSGKLAHNLGISQTNQKWSTNFYGTNIVDEDGTPTGWLVDKYDSNTLFFDFSNRAATDQVEMFMEDRSLSPTTVGSQVPYDVIHSSNPSFPIAHGQTGVPELIAFGELTSGVWEPISLTGQVTADSTNFVSGSSLASFFTAGYLRVRLVARNVGPVQTGVPLATTGLDGLIGARAKGHQKMGGLKGFIDGGYFVGNHRGSEGAGTTTLSDEDRRHQIFSLTATRTVVLPSTSVLKGDEWIIENTTAFALTIQSSALTTLITLGLGGRVSIRALQDAPTAITHWFVQGSTGLIEGDLGTLTWNGGTAPSGTITKKFIWSKNGKVVTFEWRIEASVAGASNTSLGFDLPTGMPLPSNHSNQSDLEWVTPGVGHMVSTPGAALNGGSGAALYRVNSAAYQIYTYSGAAVATVLAFGQLSYLAD